MYLILNEYFTNSNRGYTIVFRKKNDVFLKAWFMKEKGRKTRNTYERD